LLYISIILCDPLSFLKNNCYRYAILLHTHFLFISYFHEVADYFGRGRKWNPLRRRLDSFDYTVKQHIVGSLLFTPLLLLLPTTSVFYIFFSIVDTTINLVCLLIEVTISIIHVTPYTKIFLWLVRPGRFPSGIWLEIIGCQSNSTVSPPSIDFTDEVTLAKESLHLKDFNREKSSILVSVLHSNYLSIGEAWSYYLWVQTDASIRLSRYVSMLINMEIEFVISCGQCVL